MIPSAGSGRGSTVAGRRSAGRAGERDGAPPSSGRPQPTGPPTALRTVRVETPEQVDLGFELADLGSRFLALCTDGALLLVLVAGLGALFFWLVQVAAWARVLAGVGSAVLVLAAFLLTWGYFVYFEGLRQGQTPGKRWAGIRVIHDTGHPVTLRGAAVRNLVRIVDVQPFVTCLVGGVTMMIHPRTRRLGDIAAGTLVVRERGEGHLPEDRWSGTVPVGPPRLSDEELEALERFVSRRDELEDAPRERLARRLGEVLGPERLSTAPAGEVGAARDKTASAALTELHRDEIERRGGSPDAAGGGSRQAARLYRDHRPLWAEYEALLETARKRGLADLGEEGVSRFASLYRLLAADLARMRTYGASGELVYRLERLAASGHNTLYRPGQRSWRSLKRWLARGFPRMVRRRWAVVALAAAALFGPAVVTYGIVRAEPGVARELLPAALVARAEMAPDRLAGGEGYVDVPPVFMPTMSSQLIANNVQVTFMVFAGGILAGLGTLLILVINGVHLGAVVGLYEAHGAGSLVWTFVASHGTLELAAVCIAGGAGLWMGSALVLPGRATRTDALTTRARDAVSLLAGTTLLLVAAGLLEGFVSPAPIPTPLKLTVAALAALAGLGYLLGAGRGGDDDETGRPDDLRVTAAPGTSRPGSGSPPR